jgi:hypothetical protein
MAGDVAHCWHTVQAGCERACGTHPVSVCCQCGERWCEHRYKLVIPEGHGPYYPSAAFHSLARAVGGCAPPRLGKPHEG